MLSTQSSTPLRTEQSSPTAGRSIVGDTVSRRVMQTIHGPTPFPSTEGLTHLQLRRWAGCPVCNLHLRAFVQRSDEITAAGVREIIVFHSSASELKQYQPELPFPIVPDPDRKLYREFGAERSLGAVLNPRFWRHVPRVLFGAIRRVWKDHQAPRLFPHGGQLGLPADILLDADGRVIAIRYGKHAYDQWSVDELLAHAHAAGTPASVESGSETSGDTVPDSRTSERS